MVGAACSADADGRWWAGRMCGLGEGLVFFLPLQGTKEVQRPKIPGSRLATER